MRFVTMWFVLCLSAVQLQAQGGAICIYADPAGTDCRLEDTPGLAQIHVVHTLTPGVTASQFSAPKPPCMVGATWLGDTSVWPISIGDSQGGVAVAYGSCLSGPVHVLTMNYLLSGASLSDCGYSVLPDPNRPLVETVDCDGNVIPSTGGTTYINSFLSCQCEELPAPPVLEVSVVGIAFEKTHETRTFDIRNAGGGDLTWSVTDDQPWMYASPHSGSGDQTVTVTADRDDLEEDTYLGSIVINSNGGTYTLPVSMIVYVPWVIGDFYSAKPPSLHFGPFDDQLPLTIKNHSGIGWNWEVRAFAPWLSLSSTVGLAEHTPFTITVSVDRTILPPGENESEIEVGIFLFGRNVFIPVYVEPSPGETVPTRHATWGRIKAMYSDN